MAATAALTAPQVLPPAQQQPGSKAAPALPAALKVAAAVAAAGAPAKGDYNLRHFSHGDDPKAVDEAGVMWGRAMSGDAITAHLLGLPPGTKDPRIARMFGGLVAPFARFLGGQPVWTLEAADGSPAAVCVACHYPQHYINDWQALKSGLVWHIVRASGSLKHFWVFARMLLKFDKLKAKFNKEHGEFLYIAMFGTAPELQGQGVGSKLLREVLAYADERGLPAYLEASDEKNAAFYSKHGFKLLRLMYPGAGAPPNRIMAHWPPAHAAADAVTAAAGQQPSA